MNEKELEVDEKYVVELKSMFRETRDLLYAMERYFHEKYKKNLVQLSYDEDAGWVVVSSKGRKEVQYVESIPKAVHELM